MSTPLTPLNLQENGYQLHERLEHVDLVNFIKRYFFMKNAVIISYWIFNAVLIAGGIYFLFKTTALSQALNQLFLGFFFFFILVPVHELIHGIGYKLAGAEKVSYKAEWKKLVFYAMADGFVTNRKQFIRLAIAPFLILNSMLIVACWICPPYWAWLSYGILLMHTAGCAGDFALISYFYTYWDMEPLTYDDVGAKISYFYLKNN